MESRKRRRTRFVCISDTHNCEVSLPDGDVLIHAGDLTNQGSYSELSKAVQWLERARFERKIVIAGNHDVTLDQDFYSQHGHYFHNQGAQSTSQCLELLTSSPSITYLCHDSIKVQLHETKGPGTEFTVFGSPYSPQDGLWAFGYARSAQDSASLELSQKYGLSAAKLWSAIPLDTDILVTHTPAYTHCDGCIIRRRALGCEDLRRALGRIRPLVHICGHIHQGRGAERIRWAIEDNDNVAFTEAGVERWIDPSPDPKSKKICIVDLTGRGGKRALDVKTSVVKPVSLPDPDAHLTPERSSPREGGDSLCEPCIPQQQDDELLHSNMPSDGVASGTRSGTKGMPGLGGDPISSVQCDRPALLGRMGRRESCVVNCAITASNWPHPGGKKLNKPIVVDVDLPIWE